MVGIYLLCIKGVPYDSNGFLFAWFGYIDSTAYFVIHGQSRPGAWMHKFVGEQWNNIVLVWNFFSLSVM